MSNNILDIENTLLLVIDIQEKIVPAMLDSEKLVKNAEILVKSSNIMNIPIICTEQYPKGLGNTVNCISELITQSTKIEKTEFSCLNNQTINDLIASFNRKQIIVCGIEAHVCVSQTVHDLLENAYQPHVLIDAVSSRKEIDLSTGIKKMKSSGAIISSTEIAIFELLKNSKNKYFKDIQKLII